MRLMSASIGATAVITAVRAVLNRRMATERPAIPSLARRALSMKAFVSARGSRTPNTTAKPRIWFSKVTRCPTSFLRAMINEQERMSSQRLHADGLEEASAGVIRQPSSASLRSVLWVASDLSALAGLPALDADHGQTELVQPVKKDQRFMRPVSNTIRRQVGAFANSPAIASAVDSVLLSRATTRLRDRERKHASHPSRYRGQRNSPCSVLLFHILADRIGLRRRAPAHYTRC